MTIGGGSPVCATLAVLAGGAGVRMGGPKVMLSVDGRPILEHLLQQWSWPGPTLLISAPGLERPPGAEGFSAEVTDTVGGQGPLRGVLTALESAATPIVVVVAVDMPEIGHEQISWLAEALRARPEWMALMLQPKPQAPVEPLPCAFRIEAKQAVAAALGEGRRSLQSLLEIGVAHMIPAPAWPLEVWTNVNDPEQWAVWQRRRGGRDATAGRPKDLMS